MCGNNSITNFGHCLGCRCFQTGTWPWPNTTGITFTTPYVPRHRKPGPAQ